jgi:peroxiredoxin Q/BCP
MAPPVDPGLAAARRVCQTQMHGSGSDERAATNHTMMEHFMTDSSATKVSEGDVAPDFTLPTDGGRSVTLSALQGKPVIVYFYPKDDTSGCTKEAIGFSEAKGDFDGLGATIIGISPDSAAKHDKFIAKYDLTIQLAADEEKEVAEAYGVWVEKSMYGKKYMGVERSTFLVAGDGTIAKAWRKVKVPGHVDEVLAATKAL